ncbi:MAG: NFACT family protein, partial [Bacteroidota bacterium]
MLTFHVLSAFAAELDEAFRGRRCVDAFSQARDELTLAFVDPEDDVRTLRIGAGGFRFVFESASLGRARKNVATLFEPAFGRDVARIEVAERDRMLFVRFTDGSYFQIVLFGPRPNVLLVDAAGTIEEPFLHTGDLVGQPPPAPRPAPVVETFEQFESRWPANRKTVSSALSRAMPLFDAQMAREAAFRAEVPADEPPGSVEESQRRQLFEASQALSEALADPSPVMYWRGALAEGFGLVPMQHLEAREELRAEPFDSVAKALGVYARRRLAQVRFQAMYQPMEAALARAAGRLERRAEGMLDALAQESRAGRYERWGHLLMAAPDAGHPARSDTITLPDIFEAGPDITIPLDERLTLVENAQRYYAKAKTTRDARAHAE